MLKTALVTGASAGLGREFVRQLVLDREMTVLATARRLDRLEALAAELPPGRVLVAAGDLADASFRAQLWERAEALPGGLDLLINNAGLGHYADFADHDAASIRQIIDVNVMALIDLTQRAARSMKARGAGQIVQVSSILGFVGMPYSAVYVASKHAVNGLVKCLRYELRGTGVRVWAACPGQTESEFAAVALGEPSRTHQVHKHKGEPTDKIVRSILRGLDGRRAFLLPSVTSWAIVTLAHWLPGPFDWWMQRWAPRYFREELEQARARSNQTP
ncbi:MAG: SDR family NAD(P)-dependent oxidoreductase [Isosphaeraceae bacterium]|nr:SDR family NAD(P)-dependent oxidoreductase [Isosphaeraceae bacterium]